MLRSQSIKIGEHTYEVTPLLAREGLRTWNLLVSLAAAPLARVLRAVSSDALNAASRSGKLDMAALGELDASHLADAAQAFFAELDGAKQDRLLETLLDTARVDGQELWPVFDVHFQGRYDAVYRLLWFALEVNYGPFVGRLLQGGLGKAMASRFAALTPSGPTGA